MSIVAPIDARPRPAHAPAESGRILALSLVHPDFLAPLYSISRVMRDEGYRVDIFSFSSKAGGTAALPAEVTLHDCGAHEGSSAQRVAARRRFRQAVARFVEDHAPAAIIASCPFSLLEARRIARDTPIVYFSFELYDASLGGALRSPASQLRNWRALRAARSAHIVCTPSDERSAWLERRAKLTRRPMTVLNAPYLGQSESTDDACRAARALIPVGWSRRPIVIHTGNVSSTQAVAELVDSVEYWPSAACLVVTNVGNAPYADEIRRRVAASRRASDIRLLSLIPRGQMLELQRLATVGLCFVRPGDNLESTMSAPNKVGEYLHAGLVIVGLDTPYMQMVAQHGAAVLSPSLDARSMGAAITAALEVASAPSTRTRILDVARSWYSMEVQWQPVLEQLAILGTMRPETGNRT